jgi:four helix bundle protein
MEVKRATYRSPGVPGKRGFEDLECYKLALDVVVNAHEFASSLPSEERYDLAAQIRRSSKSVTDNIAEGYGRYHYLDSLKFYSIARGELSETLAHFINARSLNYMEQDYFEQLYRMSRQAEKALNGFMSYVRQKRAGHKEFGDRVIREDFTNYHIEKGDGDVGKQTGEQVNR